MFPSVGLSLTLHPNLPVDLVSPLQAQSGPGQRSGHPGEGNPRCCRGRRLAGLRHGHRHLTQLTAHHAGLHYLCQGGGGRHCKPPNIPINHHTYHSLLNWEHTRCITSVINLDSLNDSVRTTTNKDSRLVSCRVEEFMILFCPSQLHNMFSRNPITIRGDCSL